MPDHNREYYKMSAENALKELNSSIGGLKPGEAHQRLAEHGANEFKTKGKKSLTAIFLDQFKNIMIWVLIAAAAISLALSETADAIVILAVVLLNAVMGAVQESRAEAALEALKKMAAPYARVVRDGVTADIPARELVPGDIVLLEAGMNVPADMRLIDSASLKIIESALTGESAPVEKDTAPIFPDAALGDRVNMAYMGSDVSYGRGAGVVTSTGGATEMGKIAEGLAAQKDEQTPLQKKMESLSKTLSIIVFVVALVIFASGLLTAKPVFEMFMIAVSLAVAAIPEGLATVVTIVLAMGMKRMAQAGAIIRKLPAVETLGSTQVICSDKTGTLTQNKMTVERVYCDFREYEADGADSPSLSMLVDCMAVCNDSNLNSRAQAIGDPTETSLMVYALKSGHWTEEQLRRRERAGEVPFDSERKLMSVITGKGGDYTAYVKGAPDILIARCTHCLVNGDVIEFDESARSRALRANSDMAAKALRVLAFAYKRLSSPDSRDPSRIEHGLVFIGLCGQIDPARPEARDAVAKCRRAGIVPVMITGDHRDTAVAIAAQLGLLDDGRRAVTGAEIEKMSAEDLDNTVGDIGVYARVSPEHKVRIVDSWQRQGYVVAMTGDGVNDAPALKRADIGVGMGITGTDVSKGASDMVLTDDNFATIVKAVEQGRIIYNNIKKAVKFLISSNMGEVLALLAATLAGFNLFTPIQILWINLVTDTFPALALGVEPAESDVLKKRPRNPKEPFFSGRLWREIVLNGFVEGALAFGVFLYAYFTYGQAAATTMAFMTLGLSQLFNALGVRFEHDSFFRAPFSNPSMIWAFLGSALLQVVVILIPPLRAVFGFVTLNAAQWAIAVGASVFMLLFMELEKVLGKKDIIDKVTEE